MTMTITMTSFFFSFVVVPLLVTMTTGSWSTAAAAAAAATPTKDPQKQQQEQPCDGEFCPTPSLYSAHEEEQPCKYWMGPSHIKTKESHGFGLGLFTGVDISEGTIIDETMFVPLYNWEEKHHPPLREYTWNGDAARNLTLGSKGGLTLFIPGLGAFAPCTSKNYNVAIIKNHVTEDEYELPPLTTGGATTSNNNMNRNRRPPNAGAQSPFTSHLYITNRDIVAGEEFVVECTEDDFDGGTHALHRFLPDKGESNEVVCFDHLYVNPSPRQQEGSGGGSSKGKGLYTKEFHPKGTTLLSSPVVPVHRSELHMSTDWRHGNGVPPTKQTTQLLLNYCFGHSRSDVLLLPYGPYVNYINHGSSRGKGKEEEEANAKVIWHEIQFDHQTLLTRRQQFHHPELLEMTPTQVTSIHGKGLLIDIVATKPIEANEEILLDYGSEWQKSWDYHTKSIWKGMPPGYLSAKEFTSLYDTTILHTLKEQVVYPYPQNLLFICSFSDKWDDPPPGQMSSVASWLHDFVTDEDGDVDDEEEYTCFLPCIVEDRYTVITEGYTPQGKPTKVPQTLYTVKLIEIDDNPDIPYECMLLPHVDYTLVDVKREGIQLIDRPFTTDIFDGSSFRKEMGIPDDDEKKEGDDGDGGGFFPKAWMREERKIRGSGEGKGGGAGTTQVIVGEDGEEEDHESFKRKEVRPPLQKKTLAA